MYKWTNELKLKNMFRVNAQLYVVDEQNKLWLYDEEIYEFTEVSLIETEIENKEYAVESDDVIVGHGFYKFEENPFIKLEKCLDMPVDDGVDIFYIDENGDLWLKEVRTPM